MIIRAAAISEFEFAHYGIYYNMPKDGERVMHSRTASYEDHMTRLPLIDTSAHLGYTVGQSAPYTLHSMEKHAHTMEAVFCAAAPIVLCVAVSRGSLPPQAEDVRAVILQPGDVAVLNRGIWHDACHGLGRQTAYYYLASRGEAPAEWVEVEGEVVVETDTFYNGL